MEIRYLLVAFAFTSLSCAISYSQNIVEQLKQFYENADMDCYIAKIQDNINYCFVIDNQNWGRDKHGILPQKVELKKNEIVPMVTIQFINTDSFSFNDDIYNYITIDSVIVFTLAIIDKKMKVKAFANFFDDICYYELDKEPFENIIVKIRLKQIIKNIYKKKPELILYCDALRGCKGFCGPCDYNGFMFVKNGKLYVYRVVEKDIYELNEYIKRFFSLKRIRSLNYTSIPIIFQKDESIRRTGHTPENEKIICP